MNLTMEPCTPTHHDACLAIFDSNMPEYVAEWERVQFASFLALRECPYFIVIGDDGVTIACAGYHVADRRARLCWGLVRRDWHRRGVGRWLLVERLRRIFAEHGRVVVGMDTSQKTCGFFARLGFRELSREANGYWPGLDKIEMELILDQAAVRAMPNDPAS